jgi:hypothetical protein
VEPAPASTLRRIRRASFQRCRTTSRSSGRPTSIHAALLSTPVRRGTLPATIVASGASSSHHLAELPISSDPLRDRPAPRTFTMELLFARQAPSSLLGRAGARCIARSGVVRLGLRARKG